nr:unnamed protein product [Callosobruchus analis]
MNVLGPTYFLLFENCKTSFWLQKRSNNLISDSQVGFRKDKSTTLALMQLVDYVQRCFNDGSIGRPLNCESL